MNAIISRKKRILVIGKKNSSMSFFITKNFKNITYHNKKYQNEHTKIYKSFDVSDIKHMSKLDKIYFVGDYNENYSNFPINESDIILAKELISFLYEDLKFKELLTIILVPKFDISNNNAIQKNEHLNQIHNYFNFTDKAKIEVLIYDENVNYTNLYTAPIKMKNLFYSYNYHTFILDVQDYMIEHSLYPGVGLGLIERLYYRHKPSFTISTQLNVSACSVALYTKKCEKLEYSGVIYYDILRKKKFFEGKFYDNIMKSGSFYSEDGELLFKGLL